MTYLSGPMTRLPDFNRAAFDAAEKKLVAAGHEVVSPAKNAIDGGSWHEYIKADIVMLLNCRAIYMLEGWEKSRGATIEHNLARDLEMLIYYEESQNMTNLQSLIEALEKSPEADAAFGALAEKILAFYHLDSFESLDASRAAIKEAGE
jgi:hypothetical protein